MRKLKWKYKVDDRIIDYRDDGTLRRDFTIIETKTAQIKHYRKKHTQGFQIERVKCYRCRCNVCSWENGWIEESHLHSHKQGCACCDGKTVVRGINDVATTYPWAVQYFKNPEDAFIHTAYSDYCPELICPSCGYVKTTMRIRTLVHQGICCPGCSDGVSYPEKFIHNFLQQLNINFKRQLTSASVQWCENYKYDFWFQIDNKEYIIEAHGKQHYQEQTNWPHTLYEIQLNDRYKQDLAKSNGFDDSNYIVINCSESNLAWMRKSIESSQLAKIFNLTAIDWNLCHEKGCGSLIKEVCEYWESQKKYGITAPGVAKYFNISDTTVRKYLNTGAKSGWCVYNGREENIRTSRMAAKKIIVLDKEKNPIRIFNSAREIEEMSLDVFDMALKQNTILQTCNIKSHNTTRYFKGYYFWYLEDYIKEFGEDALQDIA